METSTDGGFSLIEFIIIVVLVSIALVPIMNMYVQGVRGSDVSDVAAIAGNLAQLKMEQGEQTPFGLLGSMTLSSGGAGMEGYSDYNFQINLSYVDGSFAPAGGTTSYRKVTVIITHTSGASVTLTTVKANHA